MKYLRLLSMVALLCSAGCMKFSETLTLNDDGSGAIDIVYSLPDETVTQISGMMKLANELAAASGEPQPGDSHGYLALLLNPSESRIKEKVESYQVEGLSLNKVKVETINNSRQVTLQLAFKNITDLAQTDFFSDHGFALSRIQGGNYRLERKGIQASGAAPVDLNDPQTVKALTSVLGGFDATIGVKTPGRILEANTTRRSLRQAVWNFDFNRDAADFRAFYTKDLVVVFEGAGLLLPAESSADTAEKTQ